MATLKDEAGSSPASTETLNPPLSQPSLNVSGRVFLITGGTQGLGLEIAITLQKLGAAGLVLVSRSQTKGQAVCSQLHSSRCACIWLHADLSKAEDASSVVPRAVQAMQNVGPITGLVNAAAITERGNLMTTTSDDFDLQMNINVRAPFLTTQAVAKHLQAVKQPGSIVNICSVAAHGGAPFVMAYSASKAALACLTKNNAAELAPSGIRVNGINMGWCYTENEDLLQTKIHTDWVQRADASVALGRILRPPDVAMTVAFLLSDASIMMTGSIVELHPEFAHGMLSLAPKDGAGAR